MKTLQFRWLLLFFMLAGGMPPSWAQTVSKNVNVTFEIEPVTVLNASSKSGVSVVRLGPVTTQSEVPTGALEVTLVTNTRLRYRVYHELRGEVTSADGTSLSSGQLLFMATAGTRGGASEVPSFAPIPSGEAPIFTSNPEGGSDSFQILYSLENKEPLGAGLYYGSVSLDVRME